MVGGDLRLTERTPSQTIDNSVVSLAVHHSLGHGSDTAIVRLLIAHGRNGLTLFGFRERMLLSPDARGKRRASHEPNSRGGLTRTFDGKRHPYYEQPIAA